MKFLEILKLKTFYKRSHRINLDELKLILAYLENNLDFKLVKEHFKLPHDTLEDYCLYVYKNHEQSYTKLRSSLSPLMALKYYFEYYSFKSNLLSNFISKMSYPLLLMIGVYILLTFFITQVIPSLIDIMSSFSTTMTTFNLLYQFLWVIWCVITVLLLSCFIIALILINQQRQKLVVIMFNQKRWFTFFKKIYTHMYAYMFLLLVKLGISTQHTLLMMKESTVSYFVRWLAQLTTVQLEQGQTLVQSFENNLLDEHFVTLISLALNHHDFVHYLQTYLNLNQQHLDQSLSRSSRILKTITYLFLALLMIVFYKILLLPMQIVSTL